MKKPDTAPPQTIDFAVLPAPPGYKLIEIDENYVSGDIDRWLSEPKPVLGFVVRKQVSCFSVLPMTATTVYDDGGYGRYALIRPDGIIDFYFCGDEYTFDSIEALKIHLLHEAARLNRDLASVSNDDKKEAAYFRRHATKLKNEADTIEQ